MNIVIKKKRIKNCAFISIITFFAIKSITSHKFDLLTLISAENTIFEIIKVVEFSLLLISSTSLSNFMIKKIDHFYIK